MSERVRAFSLGTLLALALGVGVPMCGRPHPIPAPPSTLLALPEPCNGPNPIEPCGPAVHRFILSVGTEPRGWWYDINQHLYIHAPLRLYRPGLGIIFLGRSS